MAAAMNIKEGIITMVMAVMTIMVVMDLEVLAARMDQEVLAGLVDLVDPVVTTLLSLAKSTAGNSSII